MSKAIITIEDQDDRIEVTVTFDPPLEKEGNSSSAQWLAAKMIERSTQLCERIDEGGAA